MTQVVLSIIDSIMLIDTKIKKYMKLNNLYGLINIDKCWLALYALKIFFFEYLNIMPAFNNDFYFIFIVYVQ